MKEYTFYDYKNQKWVYGLNAIRLRIAAIDQELKNLQEPDKDKLENFCRFTGITDPIFYQLQLKKERADLEMESYETYHENFLIDF